MSDMTDTGPVLAADGTPLKASLRRSLRREKMRALLLIAPLLIFVLVSFIAPIGDMLFRSVQNDITSQTLPRTVVALEDWDYNSGEMPDEVVYEALARDFAIAVEEKAHTRLGSRLNYEETGISSLFRKTGRGVDEIGEEQYDALSDVNDAWEEGALMASIFADPAWIEGIAEAEAAAAAEAESTGLRRVDPVYPGFRRNADLQTVLPQTLSMFGQFARVSMANDDNPLEEDVWPIVYHVMAQEIGDADFSSLPADQQAALTQAQTVLANVPVANARDAFLDIEEDWADVEVWGTIQTFSSPYTAGYFLASVDLELSPNGVEQVNEDVRIYITLFGRTLWMSLLITFSCIALGYPVAWLMANLPARSANLLMILVLLPFWTSLLVRTSAWKVLLQQQGVINDTLVWIGLVADDNRLALINNATGTVIAMTHILLPFMILPLYSVMKGIPPSYLRAAKSLGATNWTAFWRVYFPQSVPGIGAGSILVFILAIGYYITPEIVGGTKGVFISNRIAFHISSSLNWGLAAALGTILLAVVLLLYWCYDRIVGIDNVKLGG
ncbi:MAG: ABC transporter permease [Pseudomonadota bacterium]